MSLLFCRTKEPKTRNNRDLMRVSPHDVFIVGLIPFGQKLVKIMSMVGRNGLVFVFDYHLPRRNCNCQQSIKIHHSVNVLVLDVELPDRC